MDAVTGLPIVEQLRGAALVSESPAPVLTTKGREWLRALEDLQNEEVATYSDGALDLILSTSGLFR